MSDIDHQEALDRQAEQQREWLHAIKAVAATREGRILLGRCMYECDRPTHTNNAIITAYNCGRREAFREIIQALRSTDFGLYQAVEAQQEEQRHG